jgi:HlyD family secretion protein
MITRFGRLWNQRKAWVIAAVLASGILLDAVRYTNRVPTIPTLVVTRGDFVDSLQFRGEVKALKQVTIVTPADAGDLQILKIAADGTPVKQGDVVVEFDTTKTEQDLAQYKSTLKSAQAEIDQVRAQARLTGEEDLTAVMKARYDVEAAKLDASKQEVVSKIEGAEAKLKLADVEQKLHELEEKLKADRASSQATIQSKIQASQKAAYDVQRAERALTTMTLQAPLAGMISLVLMWRAEGESPFKPGDRAWPGAPIAELPDVSTLRISARVEETERGRLALEQIVTAHMDAIADREFSGRIEKISTIATSDFSGGWPFPRNFDLSIALDQTDARLKPGMTAQLTVVVDKVPNALTIPVQASFQKSGRTVAYVWAGSKFREHGIEIGRRSGDRILVVKGLQPNDRVALDDPTAKE